MKEETKKLIEDIISYVVAVAIIIAIPVLTGVIICRDFQHRKEVTSLIWEIGDARAEAETYGAINEMLIDLLDEKNQQLSELLTSNRIYVKVENDGDFELIYKNQLGWNYLRMLGGIVVEERCFGDVKEEFILIFLGERITEFEII